MLGDCNQRPVGCNRAVEKRLQIQWLHGPAPLPMAARTTPTRRGCNSPELFPFAMTGPELDTYVKKQVADYKVLAKEFGLIQ